MFDDVVFKGYSRPDSSVGIRNYLGIIPTVNCCNEIAVRIASNIENAIPLTHIERTISVKKYYTIIFIFLIKKLGCSYLR